MPIDIMYVERVDRTMTRNPFVDHFLVSGQHIDGRLGGFQAATINNWCASVCQRAKELHAALQVTWKDGRVGKDIVTVELLTDQAARNLLHQQQQGHAAAQGRQ